MGRDGVGYDRWISIDSWFVPANVVIRRDYYCHDSQQHHRRNTPHPLFEVMLLHEYRWRLEVRWVKDPCGMRQDDVLWGVPFES